MPSALAPRVATKAEIRVVQTKPIAGQRPGTSGLRKKARVFETPQYLENFVQSALDVLPKVAGARVVLGGDGRYGNDRAIQVVLRMLAAAEVAEVLVGAAGLLSTPVASGLIRARRADFGFLLSASHNPGGPDGDFGIKINGPNGAPATEALTEAIFRRSQEIDRYRIVEAANVDVSIPGALMLGSMAIDVVDPVALYASAMEGLFDFARIGRLLRSNFKFRFDAMHAVNGPYARQIFEDMLGAPAGTVINAVPLADFGGHHPDPNPTHAATLIDAARLAGGPDFAAATDGDGDRHMVVSKRGAISPADSIAVLVANAAQVPGYARKLVGVARSMPTSLALDRVALALGIPIYETPTGWKFFGNLLDAGRITICGEESAGAGSDHGREKDGLWAVLFWLNVVAARGLSPDQLLVEHWSRFGRDYCRRLDFEAIPEDKAGELIGSLRRRLAKLPGRRIGGLMVEQADEFRYVDPVDGSISEGQGLRIMLSGDARIVYRLSGTGTEGATLRVYVERYAPPGDRHDLDPGEALGEVTQAALDLAEIEAKLGRRTPDVIQ